MKNYKVNHFVSDFLLEPWKSNHNSNRGVWCYNFENGEIYHRSPKRVFARNRVFTPQLEKRYNHIIETPISRFIKSLETGKSLEMSDWEIQRALYLIFLVQSSRVNQALKPEEKNSFSHFFDKNDLTLDLLVIETMKHSNIARVTASPRQPLFCPLLGIFPVPYLDPKSHTQWSYAFGIPITPHVALVFVSKTVKIETINSIPLWSYSVGLPPVNTTIVIAPHVAEKMPHNKIKKDINFARNSNLELFKLAAELQPL